MERVCVAVLGVAAVAAWEVVGGGDGAVAVWEVVGGSDVTRPLSLPVFTEVVVIPGHVKREGRGGSYSKRTAESKRFKEIRSWKRELETPCLSAGHIQTTLDISGFRLGQRVG